MAAARLFVTRCLRHHVWMAACDDCRLAHIAEARRREAGGL